MGYKCYLGDWIKLNYGVKNDFLSQNTLNNYLRNYLRKQLGAYLGYGIHKGHLGGYIKPTYGDS